MQQETLVNAPFWLGLVTINNSEIEPNTKHSLLKISDPPSSCEKVESKEVFRDKSSLD